MKMLNRTPLLAAAVWLTAASPALAQATGGGGSNLEPLAQAILDLLTGNVARIFAAIAVVIVGYLYWAGRGSAQACIGRLAAMVLIRPKDALHQQAKHPQRAIPGPSGLIAWPPNPLQPMNLRTSFQTANVYFEAALQPT